MKAMMPQKLSTEAQKGDVLALGRFKRAGSPAKDKEPFLAFRKVDDPFRVACIRNGDAVEFFSPLWPQFDGRRAHARVPQAARERLEWGFDFVNSSGELFLLRKLPLDLKCRVLYKGTVL